jgi:glutathione S-transferase/RNA polymerase-associated protein
MLTLYDNGLSPFAQKVKMALIEKELAFDCIVPDLSAPEDNFLEASPLREVPVLVDDGVAIFESSIILGYLEDKWPNPTILPIEPIDRARSRLVESICDSQLEAIIFGMTEFIAFKRDQGALAQTMLIKAKSDIGHLLQWLNAQLGARDFFNGDSFGWADMAVLPYLNTLSLYKLGPASDTHLAKWFDRCKVRPSFLRCTSDAKAEVANFKESVAKVYAGKWPRQYRNHRLDWFIRNGGAEIVLQGVESGTIRFSCLPQQA